MTTYRQLWAKYKHMSYLLFFYVRQQKERLNDHTAHMKLVKMGNILSLLRQQHKDITCIQYGGCYERDALCILRERDKQSFKSHKVKIHRLITTLRFSCGETSLNHTVYHIIHVHVLYTFTAHSEQKNKGGVYTAYHSHII